MCLDMCRAPDHLQHEREMTRRAQERAQAFRNGQSLEIPVVQPWPFDLQLKVDIARLDLQIFINALVEKHKDAMFWGVPL